jgi:very-short-patch-repair endonuclease
MRDHPTKAEQIFRARLSSKHIPFKTQEVIGRYIVDFILLSNLVIIELDGRGHYKRRGIQYDQKRTRFLESLGFTVKRYPNQQVAELHIKRSWKSKDISNNLEALKKRKQKAEELIYEEARILDTQVLTLKMERNKQTTAKLNRIRPIRIIKKNSSSL